MSCFSRRKCLENTDLKIATIFSYTANEDDADANGFIPEEISIAAEPDIAYATNPHTREKLDEFIGHYNQMSAVPIQPRIARVFTTTTTTSARRLKNARLISYGCGICT